MVLALACSSLQVVGKDEILVVTSILEDGSPFNVQCVTGRYQLWSGGPHGQRQVIADAGAISADRCYGRPDPARRR